MIHLPWLKKNTIMNSKEVSYHGAKIIVNPQSKHGSFSLCFDSCSHAMVACADLNPNAYWRYIIWKYHQPKHNTALLTHWGRVTHICVSKLIIIGSDNGLSPSRRQAII